MISARSFALAALVIAGCSDDGEIVQSPISIVAENRRSSDVYLEWTGDARWVFQLEIRRSDRWEPVAYMPPQCIDVCSADNASKDCTVACKPAPVRAKLLRPGEVVTLDWPGKAYTTSSTHCSAGDCYQSGRPERGHHRWRACVYPAASCAVDPCPAPDADGVIEGTISGSASCSDAELKLPFSEATLKIAIE